MQIQSKPTTVLLAIIALLLAANLFVNLPPQEAKAQTQLRAAAGDDDDVVLVGIAVTESSGAFRHVLRLWSDGVVEHRIASAPTVVGPMNWDVPPAQFSEWTEIVPLP